MEKRQCRVADSLLAGETAPPWLRHWQTHRVTLRRRALFSHCLPLSLVVPAREPRLDSGAVGRKSQPKKATVLPPYGRRTMGSGATAPQLEGIRRRRQPNHGGGTCLSGEAKSRNASQV